MPDKTYASDLRSSGARHHDAPTRGSSVSAPDTAGIQIAGAPGRALRLPSDVLAMQRAVGNRVVTSLLSRDIGRNMPGLAAVRQKPVATQPTLVQRAPETWYRGEAEGVSPARPGSVIHDFGDGLYLAGDQSLAAQYASLRAGPNPETGRVLAATFERSLLGRVLNLNTDPRWAAFMGEKMSGGVTNEGLIRLANENYWHLFQAFLQRNGLSLDNFDAIIGPEYVRNGTQMCIRNPSIAGQIRAMLAPAPASPTAKPPGGPGPDAPTELPVKTQYNVLSTQKIPGNRVVSDVEVILGDGLEVMNGRIVGEGGQPVPGRFILRITTDANGALVAAEATSTEAAALAETLARQALQSAPKVGVAGAGGGGAAGAARAVSPWVKGASWAGLALFILVTGYRYQTATSENKPRVLARAGGGLAAGMLASYGVCNLVLGIETLGWSLLICGALVGVPAGMAGEAAADVAYDEATIDDDEIRAWVAAHGLADIERLPATEKLRMILSVMRGWVSDDDIAAIQRILGSVSSAAEMTALRRAIEPHLSDLSSIGQRTQVRVALARRI
ncbi:MAG: hypothetical protein U0X20_00100 [Caldilineaceae bacterium]